MPELRNSTPTGYTSVAPWVVTDDTGTFLDFVSHVSDDEELARVETALSRC
jgi:hypothetical protein